MASVQPTLDSAALPQPPKRGKGGLPAVLLALSDALGDYVRNATLLPSLNIANGSARQQRSERRVACVRLMRSALTYLDLASLRVGIPIAGGEFKHITLAFLAKRAGLGLRRAERALADLQHAGLIDVRRRCEVDESGNFRGLAAFKFIPAALFGVFKLGNWLSRERAKARLRRARADAASRRTGRDEQTAAHGKLMVRTVLRAAARGTPARRQPKPEARDQAVEDNRRLQLAAARHYAAHPERGRDWAYDQAQLELGLAELA